MTELRELLSPLREELPTDAEIARVLRAVPRKPRRRRRAAAVLVAATAAAGIAIAALPAEKTPLPSTATGLLRAAAASAAEQPDFSGYRYVEAIDHWTYPPMGRDPVTEVEQRVETWVDRNWQGRWLSQRGRVIQGGGTLLAKSIAKPSDRPYMYGDGPLADLDIAKLPNDPKALRDALVTQYKSLNWAAGHPTAEQIHYDIVRELLNLLSTANTTPELRAGLWGALALTDGLQKAGENSVRIPTGRSGGNFTVVFDVSTSEMLSWSEVGSGAGTPDQTHTFVRAAHVTSIGDRPAP
jgi:hypothetical protein